MINSCCACVGINNNNKFSQFITYLQVVIVAVPTTILIPTDPRIRQFHPFTHRHLHAFKDPYKYSFFPNTIIHWNLLPQTITLLVLWYLLQAYLAARHWTISILLQCSAVWGFQTEHAYSSFGRTRDRKDPYKYSFFPNTIIHWNLLPQTIVLCPTVNTFREQLTPTVHNHLQSQI
jgi:hypothetical protein